MTKIEGARINLRPPRKADAPTIYQYASDRAISLHTFIPYPYTIKDALEFIKFARSARRSKSEFHFAMEDRQSGEVVGMIGLMAARDPHHKAELGYWVGQPFWGKGLAGEAIDLILSYAFNTLKLHRVQAYVFPANEASARVLEKAGFTREGLIREGQIQEGTYRDAHLYSILEQEWRGK